MRSVGNELRAAFVMLSEAEFPVAAAVGLESEADMIRWESCGATPSEATAITATKRVNELTRRSLLRLLLPRVRCRQHAPELLVDWSLKPMP